MLTHDKKKGSETTRAILTLVCYIPQTKSEDLQTLRKFFQEQGFDLKRLQDKQNLNSFGYSLKNANFLAQSRHLLTQMEFERIASFLFSQATLIVLCYQHQIWNFSRFDKIKKMPLLSLESSHSRNHATPNLLTLKKQKHVFRKRLAQLFF